jgi:hypothetical protein
MGGCKYWLIQATDIQKCKKCKSVVEKISGCNHMTCGFASISGAGSADPPFHPYTSARSTLSDVQDFKMETISQETGAVQDYGYTVWAG